MKKVFLIVLALTMCLSTAILFSSCACEHVCTTEGEWDATHHWSVCDKCGETYDKAEHTWGEASRVSVGTHMHACTVCKKQAYLEYETKITADTFETAMTLGNNFTLIAEMKVTTGVDAKSEFAIERQGDKFSLETVSTSSEAGKIRSAIFAEIVDGKVYEYEVDFDKDDNISACVKEEMEGVSATEYFADFENDIIPDMLHDFSLYTYDEDSQTYKTASIANYLTNVELGFEDNKIVLIKYTLSDYSYTMEITYGNADITIPAVTQ